MNKEQINNFIKNYKQKEKDFDNLNNIENINKEIKLNFDKFYLKSKKYLKIAGCLLFTGTIAVILQLINIIIPHLILYCILIFVYSYEISAFIINSRLLKLRKKRIRINKKNIKEVKKEIKKDQLIILEDINLIKELLLNNTIDIVTLNNKTEIYDKIYNNIDLLNLIKTNRTKIKNDFNQYIEDKNKNNIIDDRLNSLRKPIEIN